MKGEGMEKPDKLEGEKWLDRAREQGFGRRGLVSSPSKSSTWYINRMTTSEGSKPSTRGPVETEEAKREEESEGK